jgi:hypothetical protein
MVFCVLLRERLIPEIFSVFAGLRKWVLVLVIPFFAVRSNTHFASIVKEETANRSCYREVQSWIAEKAREGHTILSNSYVPTPYDSSGIVMANLYSFETLKGTPYSAMALNKAMYNRYLVGDKPSDFDLVDFRNRDWRPVREFYSYFKDGRDVKTPDGREWHMVSAKCDIQLWQVKP